VTVTDDATLLGAILDELRELSAAVAALSPQPKARRLVDAGTIAVALGVSRAWVYAHSGELGATRLGEGSRPRLRFDLDLAFACSSGKRSQNDSSNDGGQVSTPSRRRAARLPVGVPKPGSILAVRPREIPQRDAGRLPSGSAVRTSGRSDLLDFGRPRA
jgi:hypothetical protein